MKTRRSEVFTLVLCILMSITIAVAGPKGKGNGNGNGKGHGHNSNDESGDVSTHVGVSIFIDNDREIIRNHYHSYRGNLPPGLAKRGGDLPPGLAKQLRRNGHLPPGLEEKLYPFPVELERRLPPLREGLIRGVIGGSAVILDGRTKVILDVFAVL
jgi:hypothetical protein